MKYTGSKRRIIKLLRPYLEKYRLNATHYIELFVGGCNAIIDTNISLQRIGNDHNFYLIALLEALRKGYKPPMQFTKEEYLEVKKNRENYPPELVGYIGYSSFKAKWFQGFVSNEYYYAKPYSTQKRRNLQLEYYRSVMNMIPFIQDIKFTSLDYREVIIPNKSIVYCDPPYQLSSKLNNDYYYYYREKSFDHNAFWDYMRVISKNNFVFISELNAPDDFKCIFQTELANECMDKRTVDIKYNNEKLFIMNYSK